MKYFCFHTVLVPILFIGELALAQSNNMRLRQVEISEEAFISDSLSIIPGSLRLVAPINDSVTLEIDSKINQIKIVAPPSVNSVTVAYRVFPTAITAASFRRSLALYDSTTVYKDVRNYSLVGGELSHETREQIFSIKGIQTSGSVVRGISLGNTQNVGVNSSINLQLEGKLTDDLSITAAFSDQNVPLQPEGNTLQIQEFDRMYIQLKHKNGTLTAGDLVMRNNPSEFLRFYKNVQGAQGETFFKKGEKYESYTSAGAALSKGKFASMVFDATQPVNKPEEGVQGPYRLRGPNNERFIIVIANSERVYLDGRLLQRGFDYDYIVDYNLGEITFNDNVIITQFTRIRVDFEYADNYYARSILNATHRQNLKKVNFFLNFYREKDNPRNPILFNLSGQDKLLLASVGDSLQNAVTSASDSVGFSQGGVLYMKKDTTVNGTEYPIFLYSVDPDSAVYHVGFSDMGQGKGNYIQLDTTANGRIYRWVAPILGEAQGRFEPVHLLPAPKMKQMLTSGVRFNLSEAEEFFSEVAFSKKDQNLYSDKDAQVDTGYALKVGFRNRGKPIYMNFMKGWQWTAHADFEYDSKNFSFIDRLRGVDFDRDWGIGPIVTTMKSDQIMNTGVSLQKDEFNLFSYEMSRRIRTDEVEGIQHRMNFSKNISKIKFTTTGFLLKNKGVFYNADWKKFIGTAAIPIGKQLLSYGVTLDRNVNTATKTDSVVNSAMYYDEHRVSIKTNDSTSFKLSTEYAFRKDKIVSKGQMLPFTQAQTLSFIMSSDRENHTFRFRTNYRKVEYVGQFADTTNESNISGRFDWIGSFFKRHISSELTYTTTSGRELKKEFFYVLVPVGEGTYVWRDDNKDGVQDLNEFYEALNPDEKIYARYFIPTDEYVRVFANNFNYRFNVFGPRSWLKVGGFKAFIARLSNVTSLIIDKKSSDSDARDRLNPFIFNTNNPNLLAFRQNIRSTFFFNRGDSRFGADFNIEHTGWKQLLSGGFEQRKNIDYLFNVRSNIGKFINLRQSYGLGERGNRSDLLSQRNFLIHEKRLNYELAWQPVMNFRLSGGYGFSQKLNEMSTEEVDRRVFIHRFVCEFRLSQISGRTVQGQLSLIDIRFRGNAAAQNSPSGYEMLEALKPGKNITWSLVFQQRLGNGLQISINYDGRGSQGARVVHLGRVQVSALF